MSPFDDFFDVDSDFSPSFVLRVDGFEHTDITVVSIACDGRMSRKYFMNCFYDFTFISYFYEWVSDIL